MTVLTHKAIVIDARQSKDYDEAEGGRWITFCKTHDSFVQHETRALAYDWKDDPDVWCEGGRPEPESYAVWDAELAANDAALEGSN